VSAEIIHGDCLEVMRGMPDASVDAVVADPPYSSGGMVRGDRMATPKSKYVMNVKHGDFSHPEFTGDNRDQHAYGYWSALWMSEARRICKPGGVVQVFTDWRQLPTTTDAIQAGGWVWRGIVVWDKKAIRPYPGRFRQQTEFIVWGSNGALPIPQEPEFPEGVFTYTPRDKHHTTGKPVPLMEHLLRVVPRGGAVLDPFAGSGSTGVACVNTGRPFVGIEQVPAYVDIARRRIADAQAQTTLVVA
jgi:site-specific DNA-methyltransferase (adenine-specific)